MSRLPNPGGDEGQWGDILNDYLSQAHKADGTLKTDSVTTAQLVSGSVKSTAIADGAITTTKVADGSITSTKLDDTTKASLARADSSLQPADLAGITESIQPLTLTADTDAATLLTAARYAAMNVTQDATGGHLLTLSGSDVGVRPSPSASTMVVFVPAGDGWRAIVEGQQATAVGSYPLAGTLSAVAGETEAILALTGAADPDGGVIVYSWSVVPDGDQTEQWTVWGADPSYTWTDLTASTSTTSSTYRATARVREPGGLITISSSITLTTQIPLTWTLLADETFDDLTAGTAWSVPRTIPGSALSWTSALNNTGGIVVAADGVGLRGNCQNQITGVTTGMVSDAVEIELAYDVSVSATYSKVAIRWPISNGSGFVTIAQGSVTASASYSNNLLTSTVASTAHPAAGMVKCRWENRNNSNYLQVWINGVWVGDVTYSTTTGAIPTWTTSPSVGIDVYGQSGTAANAAIVDTITISGGKRS